MSPERGGVPDWAAARPRAIERALDAALAKPTGNWFVLGASRAVRAAPPPGFRPRRGRPGRPPGPHPLGTVVRGRELVAWRDPDGTLAVASGVCPHLGAPLAEACVLGDGRLRCPWHGLELGAEPHGPWRRLPAHDDGVLAWVRLDEAGEDPTDAPVLGWRPAGAVAAVLRVEAACDPADVLANRLDPWHGPWLHPASFARLEVLADDSPDGGALLLDVTYRLPGGFGVPVRASFSCPDARTITMRILDGEGAGSVVETHATPLEAGRSAIVEATLVHSDRPGFEHAHRAEAVLRPVIRWAAGRLWVDDAAYAARRKALRDGRIR